MLNAHKAMYAAAKAGDLAAFNRQRSEVIRLFMILGIQNALKYAELMDAARARNEPEVVEAEQVGGNLILANNSLMRCQGERNVATNTLHSHVAAVYYHTCGCVSNR